MRIIVPFAAAGPNDFIARVTAQKLGERWGQPVQVENRPGAGGLIPADGSRKRPGTAAARAAAAQAGTVSASSSICGSSAAPSMACR